MSQTLTATSTGHATQHTIIAGGLNLDAYPYNLNNNTCKDFVFLNSSQQWAAVDGDKTVQKFQEMYQGNLLICDQCYGLNKEQCNDQSIACGKGLYDLAQVAGSTDHRWDTAAAHFANDADITDLQCRIQTGPCTGAPTCESCNGPGSFVILKSLEVASSQLVNTYNAIMTAGELCDDQMSLFSSIFAPVPDIKDTAIFLGVATSIIGGIFGFIPGIGGVLSSLLVGVGSSVAMDEFLFDQPGPADTASILGYIANQTASSYVKVSDGLFSNGTYTYVSADGKKASTISLPALMKGGALMQASANSTELYTALIPVYQRIMFQQLAVFTWNNMQKDNKNHHPFITFTPGSCDKVTAQTPGFERDGLLDGVYKLESSITYNDTCWWLLDASRHEITIGSGKTQTTAYECKGDEALPGATIKELAINNASFSNLALEDFIIPSIDGWAKNDKSNDYETASSNGQLTIDPRAPGALNIPVCDYVANKDFPGVNCPLLGHVFQHQQSDCAIQARNTIDNAEGSFAPGLCRVHVYQYQKDEGDQNIFGQYQLRIDVYDDADRRVGDAAKQLASVPLAIAGALPYHLIAGVGSVDKDAIEFWYADDYWNSNDGTPNHKCGVGAYDSGIRQLDCWFPCPAEQPTFNGTHSATATHQLSAAPTDAIIGDQTFVNTYPSPTSTDIETPTPTQRLADIPDNVRDGTCHLHVRQYQKNEKPGQGDNPTTNYELEVTIWDKNGQPVGQSGMVSAPAYQPVTVLGLSAPLTVTAQRVDEDPIQFLLKKLMWDSSATNGPRCSVGAYDTGHRDMDCWFDCNPTAPPSYIGTHPVETFLLPP